MDGAVGASAVQMTAIASRATNYDLLLQNMTDATGMQYELDGYMSPNHSHGALVLEGSSQWPVFKFTNPDGTQFHHVVTCSPDGRVWHRFGHAVNSTNTKRQESAFNEEAFTSGGLDFLACNATDASSDRLNVGDFTYIQATVQCAFPQSVLEQDTGLGSLH